MSSSSSSSSSSHPVFDSATALPTIAFPRNDAELLDYGYVVGPREDQTAPQLLFLFDHRFECGREVIERHAGELEPSSTYVKGVSTEVQYVNFIDFMVKLGHEKFAVLPEERKQKYIQEAAQLREAYNQRLAKDRSTMGKLTEQMVEKRNKARQQAQERNRMRQIKRQQNQDAVTQTAELVQLHSQKPSTSTSTDADNINMFWDKLLGTYAGTRIFSHPTTTVSAPRSGPLFSTGTRSSSSSSSCSSSSSASSVSSNCSTSGSSIDSSGETTVRGPFYVFQTSCGHPGNLSVIHCATETDLRREFDEYVLEFEEQDQEDPESFRSQLIQVNQRIPLDQLMKFMVQYGNKQVQFTRGWMAVVEGGSLRAIER